MFFGIGYYYYNEEQKKRAQMRADVLQVTSPFFFGNLFPFENASNNHHAKIDMYVFFLAVGAILCFISTDTRSMCADVLQVTSPFSFKFMSPSQPLENASKNRLIRIDMYVFYLAVGAIPCFIRTGTLLEHLIPLQNRFRNVAFLKNV